MKAKSALITGITGQDGAYLARLLLEKGYAVHGLRRRSSLPNLDRIQDLVDQPQHADNRLFLHYGDMTDGLSLMRIIREIEPDEIYNLAAQSHVHVSFSSPEYTTDVNGTGTLRILDAIHTAGLTERVRFYQASTSELYGDSGVERQDESTGFHPRSPYGVSKLFAYWATINYREAYGMYACNGVLFNHESKLRGMSFVTRKITSAVAQLAYGLSDCLYLGNMNARRDWGHAKDYVEAQWLILQQDQPDDYVIASGRRATVRDFVQMSFAHLGVTVAWEGEGVDEVGIVEAVDAALLAERVQGQAALTPGQVVVRIDPYYFRPSEVDNLWGDASKAMARLGWAPRTSLEGIVEEMMAHDLQLARGQMYLKGIDRA